MTDTRTQFARTKHQYRRQNDLVNYVVTLGNALGEIASPNNTGRVWIGIYSDIGVLDYRLVLAPTKSFPLVPNTPVTLKRNRKGQLQVDEPDTVSLIASNINPVGYINRQESSSTTQSDFETLRAMAQSTPTLFVSIRAWVALGTGTVSLFSGASVDLTSYVPSAGNMCFASIFVLPDFSGVEVKTSTPRGVSDMPLDADDILECVNQATGGSTAVWAIKLSGGQTQITQRDIDIDGYDLRQMVNNATASSTALYAPYVAVSTTYAVGANDGTINCTTGTFTVTLPTAVGITGRVYTIKNSGAGTITAATTSSQTIDGLTTQSVLTGNAMKVQSTGSNWIVI